MATNQQKREAIWSDRITGLIFTAAAAAAIIASLVVIAGGGSAMDKLKLATGYATLIFLFFLSMVVLLDIVRNRIDLSEMLEELSGGASMSRFQLLVFTFVIAFSFFVIVVSQGKLPEIPGNVLALLGVSASTYAVSKGLQVTSPPEQESQPVTSTQPATTPANPGSAAGTTMERP
jgi:peptidoglycan/LPS O-acetylase OafA/YrhL